MRPRPAISARLSAAQAVSPSMNRELTRVVAALGAAALLLPSAAVAKGKPDGKPAHGKSKPANYVFKGVWHADGTVTVSGGNARVRKGGLDRKSTRLNSSH